MSAGAGIAEFLTKNLGYKLLSLAFAVLCWAWVQDEQQLEQRLKVPIEWVMPDGLTPLEAPLDAAFVLVQGAQGTVRSVPQGLKLVVNLTKATDGEVAVELAESNLVGLPPQVRVMEIQPQRLKVVLDRIRSRRVRVVGTTRGDPAPGYRIASVSVEPERVDLSGPATLLQTLAEVKTDAVDLTGIRENAEFEVGLQTRRIQLTASKPTRVKVKVVVEATVKERKFEDVPVLVRNPAWQSDTPKVSVTVTGGLDAIDKLDSEGISAVVYVPDDAGEPSEAAWGPTEGVRLEVTSQGGSAVDITAVEPSRVGLVRREEKP